jgi:hypothetical protein
VDWLEFKPKDPENNIMQGFYKNGERHNISFLAGNYRAFCLITKSVNRLLKDNNHEIIHFQNRTPKEQVMAVKKLTSILKKYSNKIFVEDSPFFQKIMSNLGNSKTKGDKVENQTKTRLEKEFGKENVDIKSGFGAESDNQGLDGQIIKNEKINTFQIKPLTSYKIEDDLVYVETTGKILPYEQDWMIFTNKFETVILENNATTFGSNVYIFPVSSLIYTLV